MKKMLIGLVLAAAVAPARAGAANVGGYGMDILVDGVPATEYYCRGTQYIEAFKSKEYSIRLTNPTAGRVAVALSVDGRNSIDAKRTSAREASKWVLEPYQTITISGWQTSTSTARRFFFTTEDRSYARWLGDTRNIGIITAAFFRERPVYPREIVPLEQGRRYESAPGAPAPSAGSSAESKAYPAPPSSDSAAATGIGRETDHHVTRVDLDLEDTPAATLNIRYEYRPELVRLGILPSWPYPMDRREHATGFDNDGFAPDPYRRDQ